MADQMSVPKTEASFSDNTDSSFIETHKSGMFDQKFEGSEMKERSRTSNKRFTKMDKTLCNNHESSTNESTMEECDYFELIDDEKEEEEEKEAENDVNHNNKDNDGHPGSPKTKRPSRHPINSSADGGTVHDESELSRAGRSKLKMRTSSTIRQIQEKLKKQQMKDSRGKFVYHGGDQFEDQSTAVAVNAVKNARRQRSKSRTKYGKMMSDRLQRPYRRWLGVSTCVASDTRYIVEPNKAEKEQTGNESPDSHTEDKNLTREPLPGNANNAKLTCDASMQAENIVSVTTLIEHNMDIEDTPSEVKSSKWEFDRKDNVKSGSNHVLKQLRFDESTGKAKGSGEDNCGNLSDKIVVSPPRAAQLTNRDGIYESFDCQTPTPISQNPTDDKDVAEESSPPHKPTTNTDPKFVSDDAVPSVINADSLQPPDSVSNLACDWNQLVPQKSDTEITEDISLDFGSDSLGQSTAETSQPKENAFYNQHELDQSDPQIEYGYIQSTENEINIEPSRTSVKSNEDIDRDFLEENVTSLVDSFPNMLKDDDKLQTGFGKESSIADSVPFMESEGEVRKDEQEKEIDHIEHEREIKQVEHNKEINQVESEREINQVEPEREINQVESERELNQVKDEQEIDQVEHENEIDQFELGRELNQIEHEKKIDQIENEKKIKKVDHEREIDQVEDEREIHQVEHEREIQQADTKPDSRIPTEAHGERGELGTSTCENQTRPCCHDDTVETVDLFPRASRLKGERRFFPPPNHATKSKKPTLMSSFTKWRKSHHHKKAAQFISVRAIKDSEGELPGQLSFKTGQLIQQLDTGCSGHMPAATDGICYGYYRSGKLRRKVWGIYPSSHVTTCGDHPVTTEL